MRAETQWSVEGGRTELALDVLRLESLQLRVTLLDERGEQRGSRMVLDVSAASSTLHASSRGGSFVGEAEGAIVHGGTLRVVSSRGQIFMNAFALSADVVQHNREQAQAAAQSLLNDASDAPTFLLSDLKTGLDATNGGLLIECGEVVISPALAKALGDKRLAGQVIGTLQSRVALTWSGDDPAFGKGGTPRTTCGNSGPDVIVGDLDSVENYASVGGIEAFSIGTISCNIGDTNLQWIANQNLHPVIGQNMFRHKTMPDGSSRFEQVGQSWLKHGFTALTHNDCDCGCNEQGGSVLGVGCSDPYSAGLNGTQSGLGPKYEVNAHTGDFVYPFTGSGQFGNTIYKRLQVKISDLDPALDGGGDYYIEGQYVTPDDASANNQDNNASYRPVTITGSGSAWDAAVAGTTVREMPAIRAWEAAEPDVTMTDVDVPGDGLVIVGAEVTDIGGGLYHYEYAVQNLNSNRCIRNFSVRVGTGATVSNIGFHDVDYHSGEPFDGSDWSSRLVGGTLTWATQAYADDPNANALRWGTLYNFRFDADVPPTSDTVRLALFRPGKYSSVSAMTQTPQIAGIIDCNDNGVDDALDIADGISSDCNNNGVPDDCETFDQCDLTTVIVASGLSDPAFVCAPEGDTQRLFIVELTGQIKILDLLSVSIRPTPFLDLSSAVSIGGERGLFSMAFHPDYDTNGLFYVSYTNLSGDSVVAEYSVSGDPNIADAGSGVILKTIGQDFANHNGGQIQFGGDGYLYLGLGDGGSGDDPNDRAQDDSSLLGKMLRLDVDNPPTYIPADNPGVRAVDPIAGWLPEVWAKGLRNPWRFSFDRLSGDLYIADVGQITREEIDFQPADSVGGENYGWDCEEGFICTPTSSGSYGCTCGDAELVDPIHDVDHSDSGTCSITGGYVYRGCDIPWLTGTYFFADYCGNYIRTFRYFNGTLSDLQDRTVDLQPESGAAASAIVSFGEDGSGELYIVSKLGTIYKIVCDGGGAALCGNGVVESGEECDDGNAEPGDGCFECMFEDTVITCDAGTAVVFSDGFENGNAQGWSMRGAGSTAVSGDGVIGDPIGTTSGSDQAQPDTPYAGSGCIYTAENSSLGVDDVDGGIIYFESRTIDLSGLANADLAYVRWFYQRDIADDVDDFYVAQVSDDNGGSWVTLETLDDSTSANTWTSRTFALESYIALTDQVKIRFGASDGASSGDIVEMAIDDVSITFACLDCNANTTPDVLDISSGESGDCNSNGVPDECDIESGFEQDCDGGPIGNAAGGQTLVATFCFGCHNSDGSGGMGFPGPNIRNKTRVELWNKLLPPTDHPGGSHPEFTQQDFANLEAFLADGGSLGRPDMIPDSCQVLEDCDEDMVSDACELEAGTQVDADYDGVPDDCVGVCPPADGDMNEDGVTNGLDIQLFVNALLAESTDPADVCPGDFSENDAIDGADVGGMISALLGL